jgi:hypothetical protein
MCTIPRQTALTRPRWDDIHQADDMRITTYAGRYAFVPFRNCPSSFPVNPTLRIQESGDSYVTGKWRTEVESDLKGIGRPPSRWREDKLLYNPQTNPINRAGLSHPEDENFPQNFNRLTNPPCTLRTTGWNRWDVLFHDPQSTFETPFDFFIPSRDIDKYRCRSHPVPRDNYTDEIARREQAQRLEGATVAQQQ